MYGADRFIERDGARLRVREDGAGETLILIHGWALDLDMWAPQFADLSRDYRVVAFDRRGFGLSSGVPNAEHDVEDLRTLFSEMRIARASLIGMSQGARAAVRFAQAYPDQVCCLVLDGPPRIGHMIEPRSTEIPLARYRELVQKNGLPAFRHEWEQHALMQLHTSDAAIHRLLRDVVERYPGRDLQHEYRDPSTASIDWASLHIPTLVLNGELDSSERLAAGQEIAQLMPDARYVLVPQAGHLANLDNPAFYNDTIRAFIRSSAAQDMKSA